MTLLIESHCLHPQIVQRRMSNSEAICDLTCLVYIRMEPPLTALDQLLIDNLCEGDRECFSLVILIEIDTGKGLVYS